MRKRSTIAAISCVLAFASCNQSTTTSNIDEGDMAFSGPDAEPSPTITAQDIFLNARQLPIKAYYDPSVAQFGYTAAFDSGRAAWVGISSKVAPITKVNNFALGTNTDIYKAVNLPDKAFTGYTSPRVGNSTSDASYDGSWDYVVIWVNDPIIRQIAKDAGSPITPGSTATIAAIHEIGHSLKLAHPTQIDPKTGKIFASIMKTDFQVTEYDKNELRRKWGN